MAKERLLWGLFAIILGFNIGVYGAGFGIGAGVFSAFTAIGTLLVLPRKKQTILAWTLTLIAAASGLLIGFRANSFVQGISFAISWGSIGLLLLLVSLPQVPITIWGLVSAQFLYGIHSIFGPFRLLSSMGSSSEKHGEKHAWLNPFQLLKTSAITLVIFGIFATLLMSADPIFKQMIETILRQAIGRIGWSIFLAAAFASLFTIVLTKTEEKSPELKLLSVQDIVVPVVAVIGLFGLFLFVQGKYLFASHEVFQQFNLTYSQYVRKGFMELLIATAIASVISYILILKERVTGKPYIRWLTIALLIELCLLLFSAWRRDMMYIEVYGLTRMRIIGEVFLFWLGGILAFLFALTAVKQFQEKVVLVGIGILTVGALAYFTAVNMDMRIVAAAPKRYEAQDLFYLANLSSDSAASWEGIVFAAETRITELINKDSRTWTDDERAQMANIKLALFSLVAQRERLEKKFGPWDEVKKTYLDEVKRKEYERETESLAYKRRGLERWFEENRKWQAYTWSEMEAYKLLSLKRDLFFGKIDHLLTTVVRYQKSRNLDLYKEERWILYDYEYPFVDLKVTYRPWQNEFITPTPTLTPLLTPSRRISQ